MQEVGTRDGLQIESRFVPTDDKIALVDALSATGLAKIEVTSFVSPKAIPALRDAEAVLREIAPRARRGLHARWCPTCAAPSARSTSRADELNLVMSASETHNLANLRMTREQSFAALAEVIGAGAAAGVPVNVSLSCCFGCPMEGDVPSRRVLRLVRPLRRALGARGITLCDTTGMAYPDAGGAS